jgi:hypothetical protein
MFSSAARLIQNANGVFPAATCVACKQLKTQHRCLAPITLGGILFGVTDDAKVCGRPICGPCSHGYGNNGAIRCKNHTENISDDETVLVPQPEAKAGGGKAKAIKADARATNSAEYTAKDLLVLAQAYIRTSKNAIDGIAQKQSTFWYDVAKAF